jgi:hypothetical protein
MVNKLFVCIRNFSFYLIVILVIYFQIIDYTFSESSLTNEDVNPIIEGDVMETFVEEEDEKDDQKKEEEEEEEEEYFESEEEEEEEEHKDGDVQLTDILGEEWDEIILKYVPKETFLRLNGIVWVSIPNILEVLDFPEVIILDTTHGTNRWGMDFLQITGIV